MRNVVRKFLPNLLIKVDVPGPDEVRDEAGEAVPGRTDRHVGEVDLSDGPGLYGGGDGATGPAGEGLVDQAPNNCEARDDDTEPEQSDEASGRRNIKETMDGGGPQELPHSVHSEARNGISLNLFFTLRNQR